MRAQATNSFTEVKYLAQQESGVKFVGDVGSGGRSRARGRGYVVEPPEPLCRMSNRANGRIFYIVRWNTEVEVRSLGLHLLIAFLSLLL